MIEVRPAEQSDLAELSQRLGDTVELTLGRIWVAYDSDKPETIIGVLPLRLAWQAEPLMLFPAAKKLPKVSKSRAALLMYLAAESYIGKLSEQVTAPRWLFAVTRSRAVISWSGRLGWRKVYERAAMFVKHLPTHHS